MKLTVKDNEKKLKQKKPLSSPYIPWRQTDGVDIILLVASRELGELAS